MNNNISFLHSSYLTKLDPRHELMAKNLTIVFGRAVLPSDVVKVMMVDREITLDVLNNVVVGDFYIKNFTEAAVPRQILTQLGNSGFDKTARAVMTAQDMLAESLRTSINRVFDRFKLTLGW